MRSLSASLSHSFDVACNDTMDRIVQTEGEPKMNQWTTGPISYKMNVRLALLSVIRT